MCTSFIMSAAAGTLYGVLAYSQRPTLVVCSASTAGTAEPVRQAPLDGVVGGPPLTITHS